MTTATHVPPDPAGTHVEPTVGSAYAARLHILLLMQAALALVSVVEVAVVGTATLVLPGLAAASWTAWLSWRIGRATTSTRRLLKVIRRIQVGWLVVAAVDLTLSLLMVREVLPLTAMVTRIALPVWIYVLARKEAAHVA